MGMQAIWALAQSRLARLDTDEQGQADMTGTLIMTALMIIVGVGLVYKFWEQLAAVFNAALKKLGEWFDAAPGLVD